MSEARSLFQRIYDAANLQEVETFTQTLNDSRKSGIKDLGLIQVDTNKKKNFFFYNPINLLAFEGNNGAIQFLLTTGAVAYEQDESIRKLIRNNAIVGYAISGNIQKVNELLQAGGSVQAAIWGYAIGDHTERVNELLDIKTKSIKQAVDNNTSTLIALLEKINKAITGYRLGGNNQEVKILNDKIINAVDDFMKVGDMQSVHTLLEDSRTKKHIILHIAYAYGKNNQSMDALINLNQSASPMSINNYAMRGYAEVGNVAQVEKLLTEHDASINYAIRGYAQGGHTDHVKALLARGANPDYAVLGYAEAGNKTEVDNVLNQGASKGYAILGYKKGNHKDLLDELAVSIQYEKEKSDRKIFAILIAIAAIVLTPISLLFTIPAWFWKKDAIQEAPPEASAPSSRIIKIQLANSLITKTASATGVTVKAAKEEKIVYVEEAKLSQIKSNLWNNAKAEYNANKETGVSRVKRLIASSSNAAKFD